jgi:hypothetical protein
MVIMQNFWDFLVSHKREALWAALCAFIFGPLPRRLSFLYSKGKLAIAGFKDNLSPKSGLMTKIIGLQFERRKLTDYLGSPWTLIADLLNQGMFAIFLIGIGVGLGYLFPLVKEPLGPWRLLPAVTDVLGAFLAFDSARLAAKKSPEDMRKEIAQIDKQLTALHGQLETVDPIAAKVMLQPSPF